MPINRGKRSAAVAGASPENSSGGKGQRRRSLYRGVRQRSNGKWVSEIRAPKKPTRIWLGTYPTPEMAAVAYDVAAASLKGLTTKLNFPDSVRSHPVPISTSPHDIQVAAAAAAAAAGAAADAVNCGGSCGDHVQPAVIDSGKRNELAPAVPEDCSVDVFEMPSVVASMADVVLLSPPRMSFMSPSFCEEDESTVDHYSLWDWNYTPW